MLRKDIQSIDKGTEGYDVALRCKSRVRYIMAIQELGAHEGVLDMIKNTQELTIITINSKTNIAFLVDSWKELSVIPTLTLIFINPFSESEKKWLIKPYIHNMISEPAALKSGIKAMASTVDYVSEKEFSQNIEV
jgi:hypothetical protein